MFMYDDVMRVPTCSTSHLLVVRADHKIFCYPKQGGMGAELTEIRDNFINGHSVKKINILMVTEEVI